MSAGTETKENGAPEARAAGWPRSSGSVCQRRLERCLQLRLVHGGVRTFSWPRALPNRLACLRRPSRLPLSLAMQRVLVDLPLTPYNWEPSRLNTPGYGFGISGTHTALLMLAQAFVRHCWEVHLAGSIVGQPLPGTLHLNRTALASDEQPPSFDVTVISNVFTRPPLWVWNRVHTRVLAIIQENQYIGPGEYEQIRLYLINSRQWTGHEGGVQLFFFHLSEWTKQAMREQLSGRVVQDVSRSRALLGLNSHSWAIESGVTHDSDTFVNPVNLSLTQLARRMAQRRNRHSIIFPACWERGGIVAAKVFARVKGDWGADARITFAYYDTSSKGNKEMRAVLQEASGGAPDSRIQNGSMSKLDLAIKMQESGFFIYGVVSSRGLVHFDTFASVVAEALAAGVIVLAPRIAALPYLYDGVVQFVDPPNGLSKKLQTTNIASWDDSGLASDAMVEIYIRRIKDILANRQFENELRARGRQFARRFNHTVVTDRFVRYIANISQPTRQVSLANIPKPIREVRLREKFDKLLSYVRWSQK
ncbi:hypothetical protein AB1Y20_010573 [Prymnesium parvum]|uniref:Glycosyl transferase family 1 domain-containing protein n=1 Tax=Prymnesium parvum TaxID=97485 RepID=A0AB34IRU4_PRYPA